MKRRRLVGAAAVVPAVSAAMALPAGTAAQEEGGTLIEAGAVAPDFELAGATRHGVLRDKVRLSDYRGETVVLAFFLQGQDAWLNGSDESVP